MPSFKIIKKHKTLEPDTVVEGITRSASGWDVKLGPTKYWNVPADCLEEVGKPPTKVDDPAPVPVSKAPVVTNDGASSSIKPSPRPLSPPLSPPRDPRTPPTVPGLSKGVATSSPVKSLSKDETPSLSVVPTRPPMKVHVALVAKNAVVIAEPLHLQINFVWLGNGSLGALEKFTIYSWRALGHAVTVYAHHFDTAHSVETLGLVGADGVSVVNIKDQLVADGRVVSEADPKHMLGHARLLLQTWIAKIPIKTVRDELATLAATAKVKAETAAALAKQTPSVTNKSDAVEAEKAQLAAEAAKRPTRDHIFNMVDVTKSYLGGTQRGIVLDLKVGPSWWLSDFNASFLNKFISYSRGGKAVTVENQCMGTMEETNVLRCAYAANFDGHIETNVLTGALSETGNHNNKWFDLITSYHQRAFAATGKGVDVATRARQYQVSEIGDVNHGPFRVFKPAGEQTNQGAAKSEEEIALGKRKVFILCDDVRKTTEGRRERDQQIAFRLTGFAEESFFLGKMKLEVDKLK
jgi:hypothetical protein